MNLSDSSIRRRLRGGRLVIDPLDDRLVQPASVDVTLAASFQRFRPGLEHLPLDPSDLEEGFMVAEAVEPGACFVLAPGEFALGSLEQYVEIPDDLVCRVEGKSSLARLGLLVHITAGYVDPGFRGYITMEFHNLSPRAVLLRPGMKIAQLAFVRLDEPADRPYGHPDLGSHYQDQAGTTASRYGAAPIPMEAIA